MRVLSLFSGAGGGDLGLIRAGAEIVAHCEIEPHAQAVLRYHYPEVPLHDDVTTLDGTAYRGRVSIVAGGSPCQDLSVAGNRAGLAGARSGLFFEQIRIWEESSAPHILWENVVGALSSHNGRDFAAVLGAIVGASVPVPKDGWGGAGVVAGPEGVAAWRVLDLQYFGPPQRRRRVFVWGSRAGGLDPEQVLLEPESLRGDPPARGEAREGATGGAGESLAFQSSQSGVREVEAFATLDANYGSRRHNGVVAFDWQNSPSQGMAVRSESSDPLRTNAVPAVLAFDTYNQTTDAGAFQTLRDPNGTFGDALPAVLAFNSKQDGSDADAVAPTLLAMPHDKSNANGGGQLAVCVTGERTHALTSEGADASEDGTGRGTPIIARCVTTGEGGRLDSETCTFPVTAGVPRRLTPRECERLQGWPDDWTRWGRREDGTIYELSDSARYRLCGNGIGAPVTHWIGLRAMVAAGHLEVAA